MGCLKLRSASFEVFVATSVMTWMTACSTGSVAPSQVRDRAPSATVSGHEVISAASGGAVCPEAHLNDWKDRLIVHHIAVGQGDATFIRTPAGLTVLVDGGPPGQGRARVSPLLKDCYGVRTLDYVVVTHPHLDHYGGIQDLVESKTIQIKTFYHSGDETEEGEKDEGYRPFIALLEKAGIQRGVPPLGKRAILDRRPKRGLLKAEFEILAAAGKVGSEVAPGVFKNGRVVDNNALSVAMIVRLGSFEYFNAGDLTGGRGRSPDVESAASRIVPDVDVFKSNHHGSVTSNIRSLLLKLQPEQIVVTVGNGGPNKQFKLPNLEPIALFHEMDAVKNVFFTAHGESDEIPSDFAGYPKIKDMNGDVVFASDGKSYEILGPRVRMSSPTDQSESTR